MEYVNDEILYLKDNCVTARENRTMHLKLTESCRTSGPFCPIDIKLNVPTERLAMAFTVWWNYEQFLFLTFWSLIFYRCSKQNTDHSWDT